MRREGMIAVCRTVGGCLIIFGLWRSCAAEESWTPRQPGSYEAHKKTEDRMLCLMLVGFGLTVPSLWRSFKTKWTDFDDELARSKQFYRKSRENPDQCPNCGSDEFKVHQTSKPRVWTPLSFTGILLGAAANSMADAMFKPERACVRCGCRWPEPPDLA